MKNCLQIFKIFIFVCFIGLLTGCVTTSESSRYHSSNAHRERAAQKLVNETRQLFEDERYTLVVPRMVHVLSQYPNTDAAVEATYFLGVSYAEVGGHRDAIETFRDYLDAAPSGKYAVESHLYLARLLEEYVTTSGKELDAQIAALKSELEDTPDSEELQLKIADLLWQRGSYEESGKYYALLLENNPDYVNDDHFRSRIDILPDGELVLLTPTKVLELERKERPLEITNINSFRSGRNNRTMLSQYYVVSAEVKNRGDVRLYNVRVFVTIYGFGNVIYDTRTVNIGDLEPGDTRNLSERFSNFENLDNIHRTECVGTFER